MSRERYTFKTHNNNEIFAGGVILYKINDDPMNAVELLLIYNRDKYEDFGGTIDKKDVNIYETVAREVMEESNGLIKYDSIIERIKTEPYYYTKYSKYAVFIIEATQEERELKTEQFGLKEIYDDIERTVKTFYNLMKQKEVNFRLMNKVVLDKLKDLAKLDNNNPDYIESLNMTNKNSVYLF
jgi:hypothetical protein